MNVWRQGPITDNPYVRNAFRVTKVPKELVKHKTLVRQINRTKKIIETDSKAHSIKGDAVSHAEINAAEEIIIDPERRIQEELLAHTSEKPDMKGVKNLIGEIQSLMELESQEPLPVTNLNTLKLWAKQLMENYAHTLPDESPSFGALELELIPPFGRKGEIEI